MKRTRIARWLFVAIAAPIGFAGLPAAGAALAPRTAVTALSPPSTSRMHIRLSASSLLVGQSVTATVVVVPRVSGRVVLQRQGVGHWRNLVRALTNQMGRAVLQVALGDAGAYRLRALGRRLAGCRPAISPSDTVDVSPVPPPYAGAILAPGSTGPQVLALQQRLTSLGYWLGAPNGNFGDATEQAVLAVQKAGGIATNGLVGPAESQPLSRERYPPLAALWATSSRSTSNVSS